jgi:hypothetical protein
MKLRVACIHRAMKWLYEHDDVDRAHFLYYGGVNFATRILDPVMASCGPG